MAALSTLSQRQGTNMMADLSKRITSSKATNVIPVKKSAARIFLQSGLQSAHGAMNIPRLRTATRSCSQTSWLEIQEKYPRICFFWMLILASASQIFFQHLPWKPRPVHVLVLDDVAGPSKEGLGHALWTLTSGDIELSAIHSQKSLHFFIHSLLGPGSRYIYIYIFYIIPLSPQCHSYLSRQVAKTKITMNNPRPAIFINRLVEVTAPFTAFSPVQLTSTLVVLDATEAAGLLTRSTWELKDECAHDTITIQSIYTRKKKTEKPKQQSESQILINTVQQKSFQYCKSTIHRPLSPKLRNGWQRKDCAAVASFLPARESLPAIQATVDLQGRDPSRPPLGHNRCPEFL